ncbi:ATP-grasp domain-containing protein [Pseudonocardia sp. CA-107938]|uniref:ATP-grasp domain-containing protein n=1 Tax=Pseudonocardia sp. CA-107938 TaxID=3240021 RepID=UPI003D8D086B
MLGIPRNPYSPRVAAMLATAADAAGVPYRPIDLPTLTVEFAADGTATVWDAAGPVAVTAVAPAVLFGFPAAVHGLRALARTAFLQNPVDAGLAADDKAATAELLGRAGVLQVPTTVVEFDGAAAAAAALGYPVVVKRTHGAQGRWVRRAADAAELGRALAEFAPEGPSALVLQPEIVEFRGRTLRVIVTGGRVVAASLRTAAGDEWRSNVARGASQELVTPSAEEAGLAHAAVAALGLRHGGVDVLRTADGPRVLEVNACPDVTSMVPLLPDLPELVLRACTP